MSQGDLFASEAPAPAPLSAVASGPLRSMRTSADTPVSYALTTGDERTALNPLIGERIALHWNGRIECVACGADTPRSYSQGYCYNCMQSLARCDRCIVSPELCHFHLGTCREPEWAQGFCMQPHIVYLANSSGLKVGITRETNLPGRWLDQGATQGMPLLRVASRFHAGQWEDALREYVADRTDWRAMLRGIAQPVDLVATGAELLDKLGPERAAALPPAERLTEGTPSEIAFPAPPRPGPVRALNFDKQAEIEGTLVGIKGQYLLFDTFVFNVRRHSGYDATLLTSNGETC